MSAISEVQKLQHDHDRLVDLLDRVGYDQLTLARQNQLYDKFVDSMIFLAKNYDTPVIMEACGNHVELIRHMHEAIEILGLDMTT